MEAPDHVLIVDDDPEIRRLLADYLDRQGVRTTCVADGREMRALLARTAVDVIVLDLMLPGEDGGALFRYLRGHPDHARTPIVMLTARADDVDRIIGLEMGADDYVAKPFIARELLARIRSVLRRARMLPPGIIRDEHCRYLGFGNWLLDTVERHLIAPGGTITLLQAAEYALLRVLLDQPLRVISRDALLTSLAGRDATSFDRAIDLRVSRLRKRLGDDAREPGYIRTIRHEGYVLCKEVEALRERPPAFLARPARPVR